MIELQKEINLEETPYLEAGFKQPFEASNEDDPRVTTDKKGIEFWHVVTIEGCEHCYFSNKGRVYDSKNNRFRTVRTSTGYASLGIWSKNKVMITTSIHRLVALAFIPNPENKPFVNHIDGNKLNNSIDNLEWVTPSENIQHAHDTGLHSYSLRNKTNEIAELRKSGSSYKEIAKEYQVHPDTIKKWVKIYVEENPEFKHLYDSDRVHRGRGKTVTEEEIKIMTQLREQNYTYQKIADTVGYSLSTVYTYLKDTI